MLKNFTFFGAPAALFCFVDRQMNQPQWSDLGMFLQTFMLLAQEEGIDTCAQDLGHLGRKWYLNLLKLTLISCYSVAWQLDTGMVLRH